MQETKCVCKYNYFKFRQLTNCMNATKDLEATKGIHNATMLMIFIDASCAAHLNIRSYTGDAETYGVRC